MKIRFLGLGALVGFVLNIWAQPPPPAQDPNAPRKLPPELQARTNLPPNFGQFTTQPTTNKNSAVGGTRTNYGTYYGSTVRTNFWDTNQTSNVGGLNPTNYGTFYSRGNTNSWGSNRFRAYQQQQQPNVGGVGTNYGVFYSTGSNAPFNRQSSTNAAPPPPPPP